MKAKDFEASAINLCNPPQVKELLDELHVAQNSLKEFKGSIPEEILNDIDKAEKLIDYIGERIREAIETHGSYQDTENERYGVKYRRVSKTYDPAAFKRNYPKYAPAVITEAVNVQALEGLVKGGLITNDALKLNKVTQEHESFAFYVR